MFQDKYGQSESDDLSVGRLEEMAVWVNVNYTDNVNIIFLVVTLVISSKIKLIVVTIKRWQVF
jgi:hypothetical protein